MFKTKLIEKGRKKGGKLGGKMQFDWPKEEKVMETKLKFNAFLLFV